MLRQAALAFALTLAAPTLAFANFAANREQEFVRLFTLIELLEAPFARAVAVLREPDRIARWEGAFAYCCHDHLSSGHAEQMQHAKSLDIFVEWAYK